MDLYGIGILHSFAPVGSSTSHEKFIVNIEEGRPEANRIRHSNRVSSLTHLLQ